MAKCVAAETSKDKILKQVMEHTRNGWNNNPSGEMLPYYQRWFEITIEHNMLLWGDIVIVSYSLREILLKELHAEHLGIVRAKKLARLYIWWPKLDSDIESMVKICPRCQVFQDHGHGQQVLG